MMKFKEAASRCHVRACLFRKAKPHKKYAKNHTICLKDRISLWDRLHNDWEEYDPEEDYMPA